MGLVTLIFDRLTLKLVCQLHLRRGTFLPNLGNLGLWVLELLAMYATDRPTDRQTDKSNAYCPLSTVGGIIIIIANDNNNNKAALTNIFFLYLEDFFYISRGASGGGSWQHNQRCQLLQYTAFHNCGPILLSFRDITTGQTTDDRRRTDGRWQASLISLLRPGSNKLKLGMCEICFYFGLFSARF